LGRDKRDNVTPVTLVTLVARKSTVPTGRRPMTEKIWKCFVPKVFETNRKTRASSYGALLSRWPSRMRLVWVSRTRRSVLARRQGGGLLAAAGTLLWSAISPCSILTRFGNRR
jgi:hypothetical protein